MKYVIKYNKGDFRELIKQIYLAEENDPTIETQIEINYNEADSSLSRFLKEMKNYIIRVKLSADNCKSYDNFKKIEQVLAPYSNVVAVLPYGMNKEDIPSDCSIAIEESGFIILCIEDLEEAYKAGCRSFELIHGMLHDCMRISKWKEAHPDVIFSVDLGYRAEAINGRPITAPFIFPGDLVYYDFVDYAVFPNYTSYGVYSRRLLNIPIVFFNEDLPNNIRVNDILPMFGAVRSVCRHDCDNCKFCDSALKQAEFYHKDFSIDF